MRIRYVCKSWFTITRNPSFVSAYRNFHRPSVRQSHLLLITWEKATKQHHLFSSEINEGDEITTPTTQHLLSLSCTSCVNYGAQSANGLICLHLSNYGGVFDNPSYPVRVLNPTTLECITLPHSSCIHPTSDVTYHFGFNPLADEYKVLQVQRLSCKGEHSWVYKIFTLGASSWRRIEEDLDVDRLAPFDSSNSYFCKGVYADGVMYWLTRDVILTFEFGDEKFRVMPLPQCSRLYCRPKLVEVSGCLSIIGLQDKEMELWILKDYRNQVWVNENTQRYVVQPPKRAEYLIPLGTIHSGELLLRSHMRKIGRTVMVHFYNRKSNILKSRQIGLPEFMFPGDSCLQPLTLFEGGSIVPLR
ncbi:PREDICTED: putative F-box protein At3g52320 [Fragaria vesca subsp. vesca]|uniref:putative F-box protein At3g52320 n=1 Tax=Fragaria vesca subsp. vesca TaxID=101020 RepID=UPI0002C30D7C|nr:PREDICTED: putative F-box protein At3g52320 [Fragaria vesca subsp. vesca]